MADKYQLDFHPEARAYLKLMEDNDKVESDLTLETALEMIRKDLERYIRLVKMKNLDYKGKREELFIPSEDVHGGIPVFVYTPESKPPDSTILIYFHGGGAVMGTREEVDDTCKLLSSQAECIVVNVEYRLAPEHKFPAMFDDAVTVARWVLANRTSLGGTEKSKVGVSGDSMGGTLTASVAYDVPGLAFQIPVYPFISGSARALPAFKEFANGPILTEEFINWVESLLFEKREDLDNPRINVLGHEQFDHVPPALFVIAEFDPLRDDSYEYSKILTAAGVENEVYLVKGVVHEFFTVPGVFLETCRETYSKVAEFIKKFRPTA